MVIHEAEEEEEIGNQWASQARLRGWDFALTALGSHGRAGSSGVGQRWCQKALHEGDGVEGAHGRPGRKYRWERTRPGLTPRGQR